MYGDGPMTFSNMVQGLAFHQRVLGRSHRQALLPVRCCRTPRSRAGIVLADNEPDDAPANVTDAVPR